MDRVERIIPEEKWHISVSIGIAPSTGERGEDYQKLFSKADRAMYKAKHGGKNRIAFFGDG